MSQLLTLLAQSQSDSAGAAAGLAGGAFGLLIQLAAYIFVGFCMMTIAKKLGDENAWWAFVPILNIVQITKLAGKEILWVILCFVPCVNIVVLAIMFGAIAEKTGKPAIVGYLTPFFGIFTLPYMAFA